MKNDELNKNYFSSQFGKSLDFFRVMHNNAIMRFIKRQPYIDIWNELSKEKKMIFLAGPRQVGKTTVAKEIAKKIIKN